MVSFNPKNKKELWRNNVDVTSNLVDAALQFPDLYFMHVSSIAAIGDAKPKQLIDENCRWVFKKNSSDYSITKFEAEREIWRGIHEGLKACIVNPSIILGYDERGKGSMKILELVKKKSPFYTNGIVGYVDVRDVAIIMCKLYENDIQSERFILSSENRSYKSVLNYLAHKMAYKAPSIELGPRVLYLSALFLKYWSFISGKSPALSLSTAKTAHKKLEFSNQKILKIVPHKFMSVEKSLDSMLSKDISF
jgi:nucleoside-diphosphate-sugar epimerase